MALNRYVIDDVTLFEKIVLKLNDIVPRLDVLEKPSLGMICRAVRLMKKASESDNLDIQFSEEIWKYIAIIAYDDGYIVLPRPIKKAEKYLVLMEKNPQYRNGIEDVISGKRQPKNEMERNALVRYNILKEYCYGTK